MNVHAFFQIVFYILMLPIVFRVLLSMRLETLFKKGVRQSHVLALYFLLSISISKLVLDYFIDIIFLLISLFE